MLRHLRRGVTAHEADAVAVTSLDELIPDVWTGERDGGQEQAHRDTPSDIVAWALAKAQAQGHVVQ